ncbi:hypothetical protein BAUCODRAFT_264292 [Baudoinia panamericana UAMH 10762]|uniref:N-acetyltransferase domain-containing protein n=1 Tax=Baudoinia panamericana (strain UAMH 10762) TaxID=717646 RepID=M2MN29_BAUPA|nr:uncharacterized protein BAUCODRAFT_264292 [Baudoinia panamericana UAMH 10762]EMC92853.1 hypothetical protein BAUCODRAFT_264292 [Baudoinia panamericana UAMH 10762]
MQQDSVSFRQANGMLHVPPTKKGVQNYLKMMEEALLGVIVCLPAPDSQSKPIPIGVFHLSRLPPQVAHWRNSEIGIQIVQAYQGQGYGSEVIKWGLRWGFKKEGVFREQVWRDGRWWDGIALGILEHEWREAQEKNG